MQSRKHSLLEVCLSTAIGFLGSWLIAELSMVYHTGLVSVAFEITVWCTVWSIARGYALRRWFVHKGAKK